MTKRKPPQHMVVLGRPSAPYSHHLPSFSGDLHGSCHTGKCTAKTDMDICWDGQHRSTYLNKYWHVYTYIYIYIHTHIHTYTPTMQGPQPAFRHQEAKSIHPRQQCIGRRAMVLQRFWTRRVWRVSAGDSVGFLFIPAVPLHLLPSTK